MQGHSSDAHPQQHTNHVHNGIWKLTLVLCGSEHEGDQLDWSVNEETDKHSGRDDFCIRGFFFVQIPCSSDTQEVASITIAVDDQNKQIQNLKSGILLVVYSVDSFHQQNIQNFKSI